MEKGFDYQLHTFDSGLRLVTVPMQGVKTATVLVLVGTGSKYESREINGISHFLEHMMFRGTAKRPHYLDISKELDSIGASYNAFTSKECTGYHASASAEKLDVITDVVYDIFLNSLVSEEAIKIEKGAVIEEINMRKDDPQQYIGRLFEKLLYGDQPAGWEVAGEKETIERLQRKDFVDYFHTHYIARNTVVAVAGNIDPDQVRNKITTIFSDIRQGNSVGKVPVHESQKIPSVLLNHRTTDQAYVTLGYRAYNMFDDRKYPLGILRMVLGGGMSSRLFDEVRSKRGLAYYIYADQTNYTDSGYFEVGTGLNKEKVHEGIEVILAEVEKVKHEGITAQELQRAKDKVEGRLVLALETSESVAGAYAEPVLFHGRVLTPEEELDKIKHVTLEDVRSVAQDIFRREHLNMALIGPYEDEQPFMEVLKVS